jgi:hypothetical protein
VLFWYIGLIPDLATVRDRARRRGWQIFFGLLCLGWRNSAIHWRRWQTAYWPTAGLALPLVISVHSSRGGRRLRWSRTISAPRPDIGIRRAGRRYARARLARQGRGIAHWLSILIEGDQMVSVTLLGRGHNEPLSPAHHLR